MRIISGEYRGRKLVTLAGSDVTRPTTDRVKESLFNILQMRIRGNIVLDLFAGSGALGIECLSRGAKKVIFCDADRNAVEIIHKNLTNINGDYTVINADFERVLKNFGTYDIIFIDAPYKSGLGEKALAKIVEGKTLNKGGVISYERLNGLSYNVPNGLKVYDSRKYGDIVLDFLTYEDSGDNGQL